MRPVFRVLRAVAALGGAAVLVVPVWHAPAAAEDHTVTVGADGNQFTPKVVRVKPGDTVIWQYGGGSNHNVTSTTANWKKSDPVGPPAVLNFTTSYLFEDPGTYRYVCTTYDGMSGAVVVEGSKPKPTATKTSTPRPTRTPTRTPAPPATPSASAIPSATPTPSAGTATPAVPSTSVAPATPTSGAPTPLVASPTAPSGTPFLGEGGLTPHPATGRGKGLPVMLALLLIGGVGSAELRALLANAPRP